MTTTNLQYTRIQVFCRGFTFSIRFPEHFYHLMYFVVKCTFPNRFGWGVVQQLKNRWQLIKGQDALNMSENTLSRGFSHYQLPLGHFKFYRSSFLIIFTNMFKRSLCRIDSTGKIPRRARQAEFKVLSGRPWICFKHFLWNFSKFSISFLLRSWTSRPYKSRGITKVDHRCPFWVAFNPLPPWSPASIKE